MCKADTIERIQTLESNKYSSSHYRNEVQRQVHQVADDSLGAEAIERAPEYLAQLGNGIIARLKLPALGNEVGSIPSHQRSIKGVKQSVLEDPSPGDHGDNGRALVQDEKDGRQECDGAIHEHHDRQLREVSEGKHACQDADAERQRWTKLAPEGLPESSMAEKVNDALSACQVLSQKRYDTRDYSP